MLLEKLSPCVLQAGAQRPGVPGVSHSKEQDWAAQGPRHAAESSKENASRRAASDGKPQMFRLEFSFSIKSC